MSDAVKQAGAFAMPTPKAAAKGGKGSDAGMFGDVLRTAGQKAKRGDAANPPKVHLGTRMQPNTVEREHAAAPSRGKAKDEAIAVGSRMEIAASQDAAQPGLKVEQTPLPADKKTTATTVAAISTGREVDAVTGTKHVEDYLDIDVEAVDVDAIDAEAPDTDDDDTATPVAVSGAVIQFAAALEKLRTAPSEEKPAGGKETTGERQAEPIRSAGPAEARQPGKSTGIEVAPQRNAEPPAPVAPAAAAASTPATSAEMNAQPTPSAETTGATQTAKALPSATEPAQGRPAVSPAASSIPPSAPSSGASAADTQTADATTPSAPAAAPSPVTTAGAQPRVEGVASVSSRAEMVAPAVIAPVAASVSALRGEPAPAPAHARATAPAADVRPTATLTASAIQQAPTGRQPEQNADDRGSSRNPAPEARRVEAQPARPVAQIDVAPQAAPAPVASGNATSIVAAISTDPTLRPSVETLAQTMLHLSSSQGGQVHSLKIQLNPGELGMVTANMRFAGEQLSVELQVDNPEAYQRLSLDTETIARSLRALGFDVDQVSVQQAQQGPAALARADAGGSATGGFGRDGDGFQSFNQSWGESGGSTGGNDRAGGQATGRGRDNGGTRHESGGSAGQVGAGSGIYI